MAGEFKWDSLDAISEYLRIEDIEMFIDGLLVIQDNNNGK